MSCLRLEALHTGFEVDSSAKEILKIHHDGVEVNREKVTANRIQNTSFDCLLNTVQYGTYDKEDAALLVFSFHFGYRDEARDRITTASIEIEFEETSSAKLESPDPRNYNNDPAVKTILPVRVTGNPSKENKTSSWDLEVNMTYQSPIGLGPGGKTSMHSETTFEKNRRMWINGERDSDDFHHYHNRAIWTTGENKVERTGILHSFPAAVVITLPKDPKHFVKARVVVTHVVSFSLNPVRLFSKKDDPILLNRSKEKGPQFAKGKDFMDADFPWPSVVHIPAEYEDQLRS